MTKVYRYHQENHMGLNNSTFGPSRCGQYQREEDLSQTAGLSSPRQLVEMTTMISIKGDQTAAGSSLIIFKPDPTIAKQQVMGSESLIKQLEELLSQQSLGLVEVYPGFIISKEEYQRRFGGIDLDYYRTRMHPDVFRTFVKGMGAVKGVDGLSNRYLEDYQD